MNAVINAISEYFSGVLNPVQIIGYVALIIAIISFQQNTPKRMIICQLLSNTIFFIHFALLGATTGAVINLMSSIRSLIYSQQEKRKWASHPIWTVVFIVLPIIIGIVFWEGAKSILPMLGAIFYTVGFKMKTSKLVRLVSLPSSPCWIIYNLINRSYAGVITEVYVIISIVVGMLRFDVNKRKKSDVSEL